jgi:hypothetical protein
MEIKELFTGSSRWTAPDEAGVLHSHARRQFIVIPGPEGPVGDFLFAPEIPLLLAPYVDPFGVPHPELVCMDREVQYQDIPGIWIVTATYSDYALPPKL